MERGASSESVVDAPPDRAGEDGGDLWDDSIR